VKSSPLKTHCPNGHALEGSNLILPKRGGRVCRICKSAATRRWLDAADEPEKLVRRRRFKQNRILARRAGDIRNGYTRAGIARAVTREHVEQMFEIVGENGLLKAAYPVIGEWKMKAFLFFNPKVNAAINKPRHPVSVIAAPAISLRNPAAAARIIDRINRAVSRGLQRDHRDDTISEMACAWLEGRLQEDDIEKRAGEFARSRFKSDHNKYGDLSLDVPIYVDGSATLMDRLSTETESGYWDLNMMASTGRRK
jgi:hypothetical protein